MRGHLHKNQLNKLYKIKTGWVVRLPVFFDSTCLCDTTILGGITRSFNIPIQAISARLL